jgi:Animal haem peroxidase
MKIIDTDHSLPGLRTISALHPAAPAHRAEGTDASSRSDYCYLFPDLANDDEASQFPGKTSKQTLITLREFEKSFMENTPETTRMKLPPIYTYFGQFVNHDLSAPIGSIAAEAESIPMVEIIGNLGPAPDLDKQSRPASIAPILEAVKNEHVDPLMLGSLYGNGPGSEDSEVRDLYAPDGVSFKIGMSSEISEQDLAATTTTAKDVIRKEGAPDLLRDQEKQLALIADRRNDENLIISQLHLALLLFHNKTVKALQPKFPDQKALFAEARKEVTLHYQWCILHDYLPRLLWEDTLDEVLANGPIIKAPGGIPMEFTCAAFRFGHSMVSEEYDFNVNFGHKGKLADSATLNQLFAFTSRGGMGTSNGTGGQLPNHWIADWNRLTRSGTNQLSGADKIDVTFAEGMLNHMAHAQNMHHASIFFRNILRGYHRRIPFGQKIAAALRIAPLPPNAILDALPPAMRATAEELDVHTHTPAWLYFLCESRHLGKGEHLGPAASKIIAETIVGTLKHAPGSILNVTGGWTPERRGRIKNNGKSINDIKDILDFSGVM